MAEPDSQPGVAPEPRARSPFDDVVDECMKVALDEQQSFDSRAQAWRRALLMSAGQLMLEQLSGEARELGIEEAYKQLADEELADCLSEHIACRLRREESSLQAFVRMQVEQDQEHTLEERKWLENRLCLVHEVGITNELARRQQLNEGRIARLVRELIVEEGDRNHRLTQLGRTASRCLGIPGSAKGGRFSKEDREDAHSTAVAHLWEEVLPYLQWDPPIMNREFLLNLIRGDLNSLVSRSREAIRGQIRTLLRRSSQLVEGEGSVSQKGDGTLIESCRDERDTIKDIENKIVIERLLANAPLNERDREIITEHYLNDKSEEVLAERYSLSQSQISKLLRGGLATIREAYRRS
jgi:RNA polymerase sigma factor (sigma-70 family)